MKQKETIIVRNTSPCSPGDKGKIVQSVIKVWNTHYHNSNLIWRTVLRRVDEVIPFDNTRDA